MRHESSDDARSYDAALSKSSTGPRDLSLFRCRRILCGVDELPNFAPLLIEFCDMLCSEPLIDLQVRLRTLLFSGSNIGLTESVVRIRELRTPFQSTHILWNCIGVAILIGIEIS